MTGTIFIITATAPRRPLSLFISIFHSGERPKLVFSPLPPCLRPQFHSPCGGGRNLSRWSSLQMVGRTDGWAMSFLMMSYGDGLRTTDRKEHPRAAMPWSVGEGKVIDGHLALRRRCPPVGRPAISAALPLSTRHPENNTNSSITHGDLLALLLIARGEFLCKM